MAEKHILNSEELATALKELPDWREEQGKLCAQFTFESFPNAIAFINKIAVVAEEMNHHPDISNTYNKVLLSLSTHDVGDKITDTDVEMARRVSEMLKS